MANLNKIMVALAFASYSEGIFRYAADLARRLNADMVAASIINERDVSAVRRVADMGYEVDGGQYVADIKTERMNILDRLIRDGGLDPEHINTIIRVGNPVDELLKIIASEEIDMVIMGLKGRTDLEHAFVGSVADKLFSRSPVTVVSYRDETLADRLRKRVPK